MEYTSCVVIELDRADEERLLKYFSEHVHDYNWILKEDEESSKARACVWWRKKDYKQFSTTPLRSFLKRLKNKTCFDIRISGKMSTEEGVQGVCKGVRASISKHYLEAPLSNKLYPYLTGLLSVDPPGIGESNSDDPNAPIISPKLTILTKLDLLRKITDTVVEQVKKLEKLEKLEKWLSEVNENIPSPLITHTGESTTSSLLDEPKKEHSYPFEDRILPNQPSAPKMF